MSSDNVKKLHRPSNEVLWEFYLVNNTLGVLGDFNKKNFPIEHELMTKELESLKVKDVKND